MLPALLRMLILCWPSAGGGGAAVGALLRRAALLRLRARADEAAARDAALHAAHAAAARARLRRG
eukprot:4128497-Pleurochrysis_carterae.AAC.1